MASFPFTVISCSYASINLPNGQKVTYSPNVPRVRMTGLNRQSQGLIIFEVNGAFSVQTADLADGGTRYTFPSGEWVSVTAPQVGLGSCAASVQTRIVSDNAGQRTTLTISFGDVSPTSVAPGKREKRTREEMDPEPESEEEQEQERLREQMESRRAAFEERRERLEEELERRRELMEERLDQLRNQMEVLRERMDEERQAFEEERDAIYEREEAEREAFEEEIRQAH